MKCNKCGTKNDKDALFCKKCGANLGEEIVDDKVEKNTKSSKPKVKTKTKTKVKNNNKVKEKVKKEKEVKVVKEKENSTGKSFIIFFLTVIIIGLLAVLGWFGYDYYQKNYNISVPNFVGMNYERAKELAFERNLKIEKKKIISDDKNINKVIKQNRSPKSKVKKNTIIRVDVGIKDTRYKVKKYIDKDIDDVTTELDLLGIKYDIQYNEDDCDDGKVLKQDPFPNDRINKDKDTITLLVCKEDKSSKDVDNDEEDDDKSDEDDKDDEGSED